jgi:hypothetical protein
MCSLQSRLNSPAPRTTASREHTNSDTDDDPAPEDEDGTPTLQQLTDTVDAYLSLFVSKQVKKTERTRVKAMLSAMTDDKTFTAQQQHTYDAVVAFWRDPTTTPQHGSQPTELGSDE